jgi:uncharacterized membrane protein YsdA (DUF1294 family)/cold shock CspA family protein
MVMMTGSLFTKNMGSATMTEYPHSENGNNMRTTGKITSWKGNKGYGFITPSTGAKQVFVHISSFRDRKAPPRVNQLVEFSLSTDKQGRPCAVSVTRAGEELPGDIKRNDSVLMILVAVIFLVIVALVTFMTAMPVYVLFVYLVASILTFIVYAVDKSSAQRGTWRTPESILHGMALIGGWPGAMIAQQTLRHKSAKAEFRFVFWLSVVLNVGVFIWLFTASGSAFLQSLIG